MAVKAHAIDKVIEQMEEQDRAYQERRAVRKAAAWMPEEGATVRATVIGLEMRGSDFGEYPCVIYRKNDGEVFAVHAFHTILRERLAELKTKIGVEQYITYEGQKTSRKRVDSNGNPQIYHDYDVENVGSESSLEGVDANFAF